MFWEVQIKLFAILKSKIWICFWYISAFFTPKLVAQTLMMPPLICWSCPNETFAEFGKSHTAQVELLMEIQDIWRSGVSISAQVAEIFENRHKNGRKSLDVDFCLCRTCSGEDLPHQFPLQSKSKAKRLHRVVLRDDVNAASDWCNKKSLFYQFYFCGRTH